MAWVQLNQANTASEVKDLAVVLWAQPIVSILQSFLFYMTPHCVVELVEYRVLTRILIGL